jgi:hypothetical protein
LGWHGAHHKPEKFTPTNEFPEYEIRVYIQQRYNCIDHIFDSINWTAYRAANSAFTDNVRTFVIKISHNYSPVGVRERRCGAATDTYPICIQPRPYLTYTSTSSTLGQIGVTNSSLSLQSTSKTHPLQPTFDARL